jgi:hypothetical protein
VSSREKIEGFLIRLSLSFQEKTPGTWVVSDAQRGLENLVIVLTDTLVVMRLNVMKVPSRGREKLLEELLRLNATDLIHGAYGIEGPNVIIIDTLEADGMGLEEFEASIDAIGLAIAQHYRTLSSYRTKA